VQAVASSRLGNQNAAAGTAYTVGLQQLTQMEDVGLHRRQEAGGKVLTPQRVGEPAGGYHLPRLAQQQAQDRPLLATTKFQPGAGSQHFQRPENAELEPLVPVAVRCGHL
jgi:hypothetical protein